MAPPTERQLPPGMPPEIVAAFKMRQQQASVMRRAQKILFESYYKLQAGDEVLDAMIAADARAREKTKLQLRQERDEALGIANPER